MAVAYRTYQIENFWIGNYALCKRIHDQFDPSGSWRYIDDISSIRGFHPNELNIFLCPGWTTLDSIGSIFKYLLTMESEGCSLEFFIKS